MRSKYYAVPIARLVELIGRGRLPRCPPIDGRFFQPLIAGFKGEDLTPAE
jgi:hypothetical protein